MVCSIPLKQSRSGRLLGEVVVGEKKFSKKFFVLSLSKFGSYYNFFFPMVMIVLIEKSCNRFRRG